MSYSDDFWAQEERLARVQADQRIPNTADRPEGERLAWITITCLWENLSPELRRQFRVYIGPRSLDCA